MKFHRVLTNMQKQELNFFHTIKFLGKHAIQTNPSKFDEGLFSDIYLCRLRLKQGRQIQDFMFIQAGTSRGTLQREKERQRQRFTYAVLFSVVIIPFSRRDVQLVLTFEREEQLNVQLVLRVTLHEGHPDVAVPKGQRCR